MYYTDGVAWLNCSNWLYAWMNFRCRAVDPVSSTGIKFTEKENKKNPHPPAPAPQGSVILGHTILFHGACRVAIKHNKTSESVFNGMAKPLRREE